MLTLAVALAGLALGQPADPPPRILAGIEIGSKGVKAVVLAVRQQPGKAAPIIEVVYSKTNDTSVLLLNKGKLDPVAMEETALAVKTFVDDMRKLHPTLEPKDLLVVTSSAVSEVEEWKELADRVFQRSRIKLQPLSLLRECRLCIQGILPDEDLGEAVMLDIGSGNVKCGYFEPGDKGPFGHVPQFKMLWYQDHDLPGTMKFCELVGKKLGKEDPAPGGFDGAAPGVRKEWITDPVKRAAGAKPGILNRNKWYCAGGSVWLFTSVMFPDRVKDQFVNFTAADVKAFRDRVAAAGGVFPAARTERFDDLKVTAPLKAELKKAAEKQFKAVTDKFTAENAAAAGEILLGFVEACKLDHPMRTVQLTFARDGTFGWLLSLVKEDFVPNDDVVPAKPVKK